MKTGTMTINIADFLEVNKANEKLAAKIFNDQNEIIKLTLQRRSLEKEITVRREELEKMVREQRTQIEELSVKCNENANAEHKALEKMGAMAKSPYKYACEYFIPIDAHKNVGEVKFNDMFTEFVKTAFARKRKK